MAGKRTLSRLRLVPDVDWEARVREEAQAIGIERPRTRGDCENGVRPCPWVSCKHHLAVDVKPSGKLVEYFPDEEDGFEFPTDDEDGSERGMKETCALDVVLQNPDGVTLEAVGEYTARTRERVRQLEEAALLKARRAQEG